jgi:hypothetical protein
MEGKLDPDETTYRWHVTSVIPYPSVWALIFGDFLHNARGALDYAAWQLVITGRVPEPPQPHKVCFVISNQKPQFESERGTRMPGLRRPPLTVVRMHQPYQKGADAASHPLAILKALGNADKHRNLQFASAYSAYDCQLSANVAEDFIVETTSAGKDFIRCLVAGFEIGAEVALVTGRITGPNPKVKMAFEGNSTFIVKDATAATGYLLPELLESIANEVGDVLFDLEPTLVAPHDDTPPTPSEGSA